MKLPILKATPMVPAPMAIARMIPATIVPRTLSKGFIRKISEFVCWSKSGFEVFAPPRSCHYKVKLSRQTGEVYA
jgi:hypothetical protein